MNPVSLRQKATQLREQASSIIKKPGVTKSELDRAEALIDESEGLVRQAKMIEESEERERYYAQSLGVSHKPDPQDWWGGNGGGTRRANGAVSTRAEAWASMVADKPLTEELRREARALQAGLDTAGGYLKPPREFIDQLIQDAASNTTVMTAATVIDISGNDGAIVPTLENDVADFDWTHELDAGGEDTQLSFGRREFRVSPIAKYIRVSRTLMRVAPSAEGYVRSEMAKIMGYTLEKAFLTGDGVGKPLGLFTPSDLGIPTSRDISTGNSTTAVSFDGLIEALYSLPPEVRPRARWLMHSDLVKQIRKLKAGDGTYLWEPSTRAGEPDRLLGLPVMVSPFAPSDYSAGKYAAVVGDFSKYWIVRSLAMEVQVLVEKFALSNQVAFLVRGEYDGAPVLPSAFARVKLANA